MLRRAQYDIRVYMTVVSLSATFAELYMTVVALSMTLVFGRLAVLADGLEHR